MSTDAEFRLWEVVDDAARAVTDESGRFRKGELEAAVRQRLAASDLEAHVQAAALDKLVHGLVRGWGERRSPNPRRKSGMFHPEGVLKLGSGVWVWMDLATPTDLLEWGRLSTRNLARVARAEADRQDYVAERLDAFRQHGDLLLGQLERIVFGYVHDPDLHPDID
ncbi:hypothetical protein [Kitasatospora purpeofusca]|uniref:hypothetical protein n=1 Tax=Kitasatospora purpeofusca TaxID=67352 RepID=UPI00225A4B77|nr:hypothetical protein [Kitasatospora purpeofusca]MCX4758800.1 hypothetical protein [Kitasatospora purpeofusca]WSR30772.1 hypothetical protein OG715_07190 [Kitasatospora purpeofusca]